MWRREKDVEAGRQDENINELLHNSGHRVT